MTTQTQTVQRTSVQSSRVYDYLYDPVYTLSSENDHARVTLESHTGPQRLKCMPIYKTMFSELRRYPRYEVRLDTVDPVPRFIARQWRGQQAERQDATLPSFRQESEDLQVTGANRYKYFRRQEAVASAVTEYDSAKQRAGTPFMKVAQTQTDYRESEAQTDPYSPEYIVHLGTKPELLTLALLAYGHGLPAGLNEVEMIERARAKHAYEASLPQLHDAQQIDKRRKLMEQQELAEWATREKEIEKIQEARMQVFIRLLKEREEQYNDMNTQRLDRLWLRKQEELKVRVDKIRREHTRTIRKMIERKKKTVEGRLIRSTITDGYADFGSQAYAPLTRIGIFMDRNSEQFVVKNKYLANYAGLLELEESLPDVLLKPVVKAPQRHTTTSAGFLKRKYRDEKQLADIHKALRDTKLQGSQSAKPLRFLQKVEKPMSRPSTPSIHVPEQDEENRELAIMTLQQVMRGRSLQKTMHDGKEKRVELIHEMRSTHALRAAEQQLLQDEQQTTEMLLQQKQMNELKDNAVDEMLSSLEGENLGDMLDFLSKELVRLEEERRIQALSMLAERNRRIREAEEAGQRQEEERRRREHDEMFRQIVKVNQTTVDAYLEDIVSSVIDNIASTQARQEVQRMAEVINDAAYDAEQRRTNVESEEIVAELVYSFLLPEVQKQAMHDKVRQQQSKRLIAAHAQVYGESENLTADDVIKDVAVQDSELIDKPASDVSPFSSQSSLSQFGEPDIKSRGKSASRATSAASSQPHSHHTSHSSSRTASRNKATKKASRPQSERTDSRPLSRKSGSMSQSARSEPESRSVVDDDVNASQSNSKLTSEYAHTTLTESKMELSMSAVKDVEEVHDDDGESEGTPRSSPRSSGSSARSSQLE